MWPWLRLELSPGVGVEDWKPRKVEELGLISFSPCSLGSALLQTLLPPTLTVLHTLGALWSNALSRKGLPRHLASMGGQFWVPRTLHSVYVGKLFGSRQS